MTIDDISATAPGPIVSRPALKALGFDLWETLITDTPELAKRQEELRIGQIERLLRDHGHVAQAGRVRDAHRALWHHCYELYWSADLDISSRQQILHFLEQLELDLASASDELLAAVERAYAAAALEILPAVVPHAEEVLRHAKAQGLAVGLISNTGRTPGYVLREVLARRGLARYIDAMVFSNEHGECKPRRSIFDRLCAALEVRPEEMVFVGDNLYVDVYGAQQCGMRAVHFVPAERGLAVATPRHDPGLKIVPDAAIRTLAELPGVLAGLAA